MPELPEVETVARQLAAVLPGQIVRNTEVLDTKRLSLDLSAVKQHKVTSVGRLGKQVIIDFANGKSRYSLAVHLRMTGRLIWFDKHGTGTDTAAFYYEQTDFGTKHLRAKLTCHAGELHFVDTRRFGTLELSANRTTFAPVGLDPLDGSFTPASLQAMLAGSASPLKTWLLRQDKLVGIGNIYACEILHACAVSPFRKANSLTPAEIKLLHKHTKRILEKAIENCGTTFSDFQVTTGDTGQYQSFLKVYDREDAKCRRCAERIIRIAQAQRSTFYCKGCQK